MIETDNCIIQVCGAENGAHVGFLYRIRDGYNLVRGSDRASIFTTAEVIETVQEIRSNRIALLHDGPVELVPWRIGFLKKPPVTIEDPKNAMGDHR